MLSGILIGGIKLDFAKMLPYWTWFLEGAFTTVWLTLVTVCCGSLIGFLATLMKRSHYKILNTIANLYTSIIRGTPILLQLYIICFGLPQIGLKMPDLFGDNSSLLLSCIVALSINSGAYVCEVFRAGLNSVDIGQSEAARSLGLTSKQTMRYIIIPQAVKTILPSLVNEFIMMIKETSLVSTLGIFDVMYVQKVIQGSTYAIFEPYIIIALIYLFLTTVLTVISGFIERKLNTDA